MATSSYKKLPFDSSTEAGSSENQNHVGRNVVIFVTTFAVVISSVIGGFYLGHAFKRCEERIILTTLNEEIPRTQEDMTVHFDILAENPNTVNMVMVDEPKESECFCTASDNVALLQEADILSNTKAILKKGQCFRFVESFFWQMDGHVLYRLTNTVTNQIGWVHRASLKRNNKCGLPAFIRKEFDLGSGFASGPVSQQCLQCICNLESQCQPLGCRMDVGSLSCGYFQIKNTYWTDCGKPGTSLETCGKDLYCSSMCVQRYMSRYISGSGCPRTCQSYAREHNGGPSGCSSGSTIGYWNRLRRLPGCSNPPKFLN